MANVDFTLDDMETRMRGIVREEVDFTKDELKNELLDDMEVRMRGLVREVVREEMDGRFVQEREYTRDMVYDVVHESQVSITAEFASFIEDNFNPAIESLQEQISEVRSDMKRLRLVVD